MAFEKWSKATAKMIYFLRPIVESWSVSVLPQATSYLAKFVKLHAKPLLLALIRNGSHHSDSPSIFNFSKFFKAYHKNNTTFISNDCQDELSFSWLEPNKGLMHPDRLGRTWSQVWCHHWRSLTWCPDCSCYRRISSSLCWNFLICKIHKQERWIRNRIIFWLSRNLSNYKEHSSSTSAKFFKALLDRKNLTGTRNFLLIIWSTSLD